MRKYQVHNQLTGQPEEVGSFEEAQQLRANLLDQYIASLGGVFGITVLTENEDGSWTQAAVDNQGEPVPVPIFANP